MMSKHTRFEFNSDNVYITFSKYDKTINMRASSRDQLDTVECNISFPYSHRTVIAMINTLIDAMVDEGDVEYIRDNIRASYEEEE